VVEAVVFAGVSTLLYHLGMGFVLFLVPLQVVLVRKGRRPFFASLGIAFLLILVVKLVIQGGAIDEAAAPFLLLEMSVVLALVGGLALVQVPELFPETNVPPMRRVTRLVLATALAGVLSLPLILYLRGNEAFNAGLREVFDALALALQRTFGPGSEAMIGQAAFSGQALLGFVGEIFWRGFLFSYLVLLGLSWWLGTRLGFRFPGRSWGPPGAAPEAAEPDAIAPEAGPDLPANRDFPARPWPRIREFRLPDTYIWPLIGSLAVVLLSLVVDLGPLELAAWNAGVILLFLYGVSGIGVLQFFLRKFRVPRGMRLMLAIILGILVFSPRANLAVFILIPGLGVSEIWLKYRTRERSNG